ncbi:putative thiol-disulfide oxidoreductase YuxK, DCC family [Sesbania bispinosa]|nr:putative thiol-disulfide oxidoreductase YuxK, DCC family [Sesbania bispinosa]
MGSLLCEKKGALIGLGIWTTGRSGRLSNFQFHLGMTDTCQWRTYEEWQQDVDGIYCKRGPPMGPTAA